MNSINSSSSNKDILNKNKKKHRTINQALNQSSHLLRKGHTYHHLHHVHVYLVRTELTLHESSKQLGVPKCDYSFYPWMIGALQAEQSRDAQKVNRTINLRVNNTPLALYYCSIINKRALLVNSNRISCSCSILPIGPINNHSGQSWSMGRWSIFNLRGETTRALY